MCQSKDAMPSRPTLSLDWEVYTAMLDDSDMTREQQKELIETLWSIVVMCIDMGFEIDPVAQICGQEDDPLSDTPPDLLSLMNKELDQSERWSE